MPSFGFSSNHGVRELFSRSHSYQRLYLKKSQKVYRTMVKHWKSIEIALACKAYVSATLNPIKGADQDFMTFNTDLLAKLEEMSPTDCEDGTYHKRGVRVYPYLRDNVFPEIQKFNKALRIVYMSNPTGVTEDEKVFMAVAIHVKKTKHMEYQYKNFDPSNWKLYEGWCHLKKIPKFAYRSDSLVAETPLATANGVADEHDSTVPTSDTSPYKPSIMSSRGVGRGQKAAIVEKMKKEKEERKRKRNEERDKKFDSFVDEMRELKRIIKKKALSTILTRAHNTTNDPEVKKKLNDKLVKLALDMVDE